MHAFFDTVRGNSAISQHDPGSCGRARGEARQHLDGDAAIMGLPGNPDDPVRRHLPGQSGEMEACRRRDELEMPGKVAGDGVRQDPVPFPVGCRHPADMARERALIDEARERRLRKRR